MRIDILSLFPDMFTGIFTQSIIRRGIDKQLVKLFIHNIRDYSTDKHKKVDDYSFSKGAGMVMTIQPIADLIEKLQNERVYDEIIYTTPDASLYNQKSANSLSMKKNIMILCGHYKGVDQRIRDKYITKEISIGSYVITGGELAAAVIADSIIRLLPGVLSDETSALYDSFQDNLLSPPVYTRPADYKGMKVPDILLSGNEKEIEDWKLKKAQEITRKIRPDLFED